MKIEICLEKIVFCKKPVIFYFILAKKFFLRFIIVVYMEKIMKVNSVGQGNKQTVKNSIKTGLDAAVIVTGLNTIMLPAEAKWALKCGLMKEDKFIQKAGKAAVKTIKNLEKAGKDSTASRINVADTIQKAKQLYPELSKQGKDLFKQLGKNFVVMAGVTAAASIILDKIFFNNRNK